MPPPNADLLTAWERREVAARAFLGMPAIIVVFLALLVPLAWLFYQSFVGPQGATLDHYKTVFERPAYFGYLTTTFQLSSLATLLCAIFAYPICYAMVILRSWYGAVLFACVICSFFASYLVRSYAWLVLLQRRGVINTFLMDNGIISEPLRLVYNFEGTLFGMVHILLPLMALPLYASMKAVDGSLMKAAMGLGASPSRAFRDVFFPLSIPGLLAGSVMVFILSLGFYLTPAMLGGGRIVVWSTAIASAAEENPVWGAASALGMILLVMTVVLLRLLKNLFRLKSESGRI